MHTNKTSIVAVLLLGVIFLAAVEARLSAKKSHRFLMDSGYWRRNNYCKDACIASGGKSCGKIFMNCCEALSCFYGAFADDCRSRVYVKYCTEKLHNDQCALDNLQPGCSHFNPNEQ